MFGVIRPAATFRRHPGDILRWIFNVAGFAVNTVGGIDLEFGRIAIGDNLINSRRQ